MHIPSWCEKEIKHFWWSLSDTFLGGKKTLFFESSPMQFIGMTSTLLFTLFRLINKKSYQYHQHNDPLIAQPPTRRTSHPQMPLLQLWTPRQNRRLRKSEQQQFFFRRREEWLWRTGTIRCIGRMFYLSWNMWGFGCLALWTLLV